MSEQEFTGYIMLRHKACGAATRVAVGKNYYKGYASDGRPLCAVDGQLGDVEIIQYKAFSIVRAACKGCGVKRNVDAGKPIYGRVVADVKCNGKCINAVGPACDCSCGGENHGSRN